MESDAAGGLPLLCPEPVKILATLLATSALSCCRITSIFSRCCERITHVVFAQDTRTAHCIQKDDVAAPCGPQVTLHCVARIELFGQWFVAAKYVPGAVSTVKPLSLGCAARRRWVIWKAFKAAGNRVPLALVR